jgi:glycosyltransferase involved in cell wall biosynthesis/2-polyprenyl-3-methyl-5-hydroxy-6-metoxy-1,4-benzoquinol methylase
VTASLRVLIVADVSPAAVVGGSERVIWEQARRLAARGHRVRVIARQPAAGGAGTVDREGVAIRHFAAPRRPAWRFVHASIVEARRAVAAEVRAHGADVLHFHQPLSAFGVLTSPELRGLPSVYTFHSPSALEYRGRRGTTGWHRRGLAGGAGATLLRAIERRSLARVGRIHVLSDYSAGLLRTLYGLDDDRVVKIEGGADTSRLRPPDGPRAALRAELGWPAGRPVLFTLRNLQPRMGLDELIRAVDRLRGRRPEVLLVIGGEGALRAELESLVDRLGLREHVGFLGFVEDDRLARCYQAADAFVLPTQALEGFGLVTVEALACGTPVLGTPIGATPEILGPLAKSLLFSGTAAAAMADDLERFLDELAHDAEAVEALRRACRRHAEARYDWDDAVARLETTLGTLASSRDPRCACGGWLDGGHLRFGRAVLRCPACRSLRRSALPDHARVRFVYDVEYPRRFPPERTTDTRRELFASIAATLTGLRAPGRLLDVGGGRGDLAAAAARLGWRAVAADLSRDACVVARASTGGSALQADAAGLPIREGAVDAIALVNVVDHTTDPAAVIAKARRVLAPGGVLAIRVTNARFHSPVMRTLSAAPWLRRVVPLAPVLHLWSFTPRGLRGLVERAGLDVVTVRNSTMVAESPLVSSVRSLLAAGSEAASAVSRGRWLIAPAIELYARRPGGERP